ncbi:NAD(P)/FAD-dependent oxidoreductase [Photorhabdus antumapuensis]|uniref:NAD(P)/FAD-dependent oxidoreductase n=1 Tax=Photorhabdus antumapuensis TaxID=2862867 RepID=UPI001CEDEEAE|nr:FAD-dependent oxidoreductase [Photorhabdus antumapuensis]MCA6220954.1 FAD-binding oxidoreductase [Photorhabdus antumapuensis]
MTPPQISDVIIVGAGIVGAACAYQLVQDGLRVAVIDDGGKGATQAGMGHLVCMDDNPAELALSSYSLDIWRTFTPHMPENCAWRRCGTLWLADAEDEMELAEEKSARLTSYGIGNTPMTATQIHQMEPMVRSGIAGGLCVPGDGIVYAPNVVHWFLASCNKKIRFIKGQVHALEPQTVVLHDGKKYCAPRILLANGLWSTHLLPELPIVPKKGQLAITDRYPTCITHQLVELGYSASTHASDGTSIAFNVQARPTGQLLIGSSRQFHNEKHTIDFALLRSMLQRTLYFLPQLSQMNILRCWSGFRAATPDGLPLLGQHPAYEWLWLAVGHEGLGVTTAPGSAKIISALMLNRKTEIDPLPYQPARFTAMARQRLP